MTHSVSSVSQFLVLSVLASIFVPFTLPASANPVSSSPDSSALATTTPASPNTSVLSAPTTPVTNSYSPINAPIQLVSDLERVGTLPVNNASLSTQTRSSMAQVTSVMQLSDVQPTDWAFQALQSLVERYGCIVGYPDGTYRGNRALSRYEFAAGLNACLDRVNESISAGLADIATREDLATIQRLQEEFATELATLRGRVDALEARSAELEANQFSTTTKLSGEVIFSLSGASGAYSGDSDPKATPEILSFTNGAPGNDANVTFVQRTRLNLTTSFSGSDSLIVGLQAYNFQGDPDSMQGTLGYSDVLGLNSSQVRLGYEPQFPGTNPQNLSSLASDTFRVYKLLYIFPSGLDNVTFFAGTNAETTDAFPAIAPFASDSQGAISRFAGYNPAVRVSGGTSGTGLASALGFIWTPSSSVDFRALYGSVNASLARNNPLDLGSFTAGDATPLGAGLFGGSSVIAAQLTLRPSSTIDIGLNYANSYHQINILGTGLTSGDIGSVLFNPSGRCDTVGAAPATGGFGCSAAAGGGVDRSATLVAIGSEPIRLNSVGATATWRFARSLSLTASGGYIFADLVNVDASTNFSSWLVGLHARDIFSEGNTAGLIFGKPLSRVETGGNALERFENATPLHLEGYINFRLTDNISVTPGVFFIFNPEGYSGNDTVTVGALRTTFTF